MSATPADDVQTSPAQVHGAKLQIYFELCKYIYKKNPPPMSEKINGGEIMVTSFYYIVRNQNAKKRS